MTLFLPYEILELTTEPCDLKFQNYVNDASTVQFTVFGLGMLSPFGVLYP